MEQDFTDFELIISDNASTDGTEEICREAAARDPRIRYFRNETNIGATRNYNRVFELSRGEFFKWASHDDEFHPTFLRRCMETFARSPSSTVLVCTKAEIIDAAGVALCVSPDGVSINSESAIKRFAGVLFYSSVHALWGIVRSEALRRTRLMGCVAADYVVLGELALLGNLIEIPEVLYRLRSHDGCSVVINRTARQLLAWHDPARARDWIFLPRWERVYVEYLKSVRYMPLKPSERLACYLAVPVVSYWRRILRATGSVRHRMGLHRKRQSDDLLRSGQGHMESLK